MIRKNGWTEHELTWSSWSDETENEVYLSISDDGDVEIEFEGHLHTNRIYVSLKELELFVENAKDWLKFHRAYHHKDGSDRLWYEALRQCGLIARVCMVCGRLVGYKEGNITTALPPVTHTFCNDPKCIEVQKAKGYRV